VSGNVGVPDLRMLGGRAAEPVRAVAERRVGRGEIGLLGRVILAPGGRPVRVEVDDQAIGPEVLGPLVEGDRAPRRARSADRGVGAGAWAAWGAAAISPTMATAAAASSRRPRRFLMASSFRRGAAGADGAGAATPGRWCCPRPTARAEVPARARSAPAISRTGRAKRPMPDVAGFAAKPRLISRVLLGLGVGVGVGLAVVGEGVGEGSRRRRSGVAVAAPGLRLDPWPRRPGSRRAAWAGSGR